MPETEFTIGTRQRADVLFHSDEPLGAGQSVSSGILDVRGYGTISILGSSGPTFTVSVREACFPDGVLIEVSSLPSAASGPSQVVCERINPCGAFVEIALTNTGGAPQGSLDFCVQGLPQP